MKNARKICLSALVRMEKDGAYSNLVLNSLLSKCSLSQEEKSFATRLFYGTLEKKLLLDYNISLLSKRPPHKLDVEVLCILRMGMYQLLFMDSIPDSAAVNESVKLCGFTKKSSAKGFVNALLRAKLRQNKQISIPKAINEELSADKSIVSLICEQYGEGEMREIFSAFSAHSRQYIKVNTRKTTLNELCALLKEKNIEIKPCDRAKDCAEIQGAGDLTSLAEFKNGLFYVQDLASQLCCAALEVEGAERILDVCAAPGGKSFTLALLAPKSAEVVSCDVSSNRVSLIEKGKERLSLSNVKPQINDATVFNKSLGSFDRILCDVPCSGLGVIGKKPEIRYKRIKPQELFEVQYKILETSSEYLKNSGILVYSTCTINKMENEAVISRFLEEHSDFEPHPLCITESGEYHKTFLPNRDGCDGFFVSAIIKKS